MATNGSGLQTNRFVESFTRPSGSRTVYTTEDFVRTTVSNYLNTNSTVNVQIGDGLSIFNVTGTTNTIVSVGLSGTLNSLDDVNVGTPIQNYYLQYVGSSWRMGPGASVRDLNITNLNNFQGSINENSFLYSSNGTSIFFKEDKTITIDNVQADPAQGIAVIPGNDPYAINIVTSFDTLPQVTSDTKDDFYTFTNSLNRTVKIAKKDIDVSDFGNFTGSVNSTVFSGLSATNNNIGSPGLCYQGGGVFNLNSSNFLTGANGILSISQGGTSGNSPSSARANLGLSYNSFPTDYIYKIMGYSQPEFRDNMVGDSIRLVGGLSGVSIFSSGTGYNTRSSGYTIGDSTGLSFGVSIVANGAGNIIGVSINQPIDGFPFIFEDFNSFIFDPIGSGGTGACVQVFAKPSYINYGRIQGEEGFGIKFLPSSAPLIKQGSNWELINKSIGVSELNDVHAPSGFKNGQFLIYNGTSFKPYNITGDISIGLSGTSAITTIATGGFCISQMYFGDPSPSLQDFENLAGTTSNIQIQLNNKLSYTGPSRTQQSLLVLDKGSCTKAISVDKNTIPSLTPAEVNLAAQVPMIIPPNYDGVSFRNIRESFFNVDKYQPSNISNLRTCLIDQGTSNIATATPLNEFNNLITSSTGGLGVNTTNNQIQLEIENLTDYSDDYREHATDYVAVGISTTHSSVLPNQRLQLKDLISIPYYTSPSGTAGAPATYPHETYSRIRGALAFFENVGGVSYFGVASGNGSSWYGVSGFSVIF